MIEPFENSQVRSGAISFIEWNAPLQLHTNTSHVATRGQNVLDGGTGADTLDYSVGYTAGVEVDLGGGAASTDSISAFENVTGTQFADTINEQRYVTEFAEQLGFEPRIITPTRHDFFEVQRRTGLESAATARRIWDLAWEGRITADSFAVVRQGVATGFEPAPAVARRGGLRTWQSSRPILGTWRALPRRAPADRLEEAEDGKTRARQLLARYGVLFRELCAAELPELRWGKLLRALRLLELSGEAFTGHFFAGIEGLQFASREALGLLRGTWDENESFWMNACDPASPCGVLDGLPPRVPSTWLVYRGSRLVLVARRNGRETECREAPAVEDLAMFHALLGRAVRPLPRVVVDTLDGELAARSPRAATFREAGFRPDMDALVLERGYA